MPIVAFTSVGSHSWVVPEGVTSVEVLVVAGGGGGGSRQGGGGGAGGLIHNTAFAVTPESSISVSVGGGGAGGTSGGRGANGQNSVFGSLTAIGGGGGGGRTTDQSGNSGGSGGGAGASGESTVTNGGAGTAGQGFSGGSAVWNTGGGGGGASAVGINGTGDGVNSVPGDGGDGLYISSFAAYGDSGYFSGGGGGGNAGNNLFGLGGLGGGGNGRGDADGAVAGESGIANAGGGGGGSRGVDSGGSGGSGIVLISYGEIDIIGTGEGDLDTFTQKVAIIAEGDLDALEQAVDLRLVASGNLDTIAQTVNLVASGDLDRLAQQVRETIAPTEYEPPFDLELIVGNLTIPCSQIHGSINITRSESSAALMNVTLIPPKGMQNITQYQGKDIILNYSTGGVSTRIYTGKVDIPEVDILGQKITLRCTDNRTEQNNALDPDFVAGIGCYSEAVFGEAKDQNDEIEKRLRTVQASLDYDANGLVTYTSWTPKATADFIFDDASIYRRTPQVEVLSRGRVVNKVNLDITYRWPLLRHRERSYVWRYPFNSSSWCGFLTDNIGLCPVEAPRRAAEGAGWPITNYETEPLPESRWYRCGTRTLGWQTSKRTCSFEQKTDENGQPVKDSEGKNVLEATNCTVTDSRNAFATRASWTASKRWAQTIEQTTSYTITAPQSIGQYGVVERDDRAGVESEFDTRQWEEYRTHQKVPEGFTQTPNGDWVKFENQEGINNLVDAINCIRNKAIADIRGSHRQNYVTLQLPIQPQIDLRHTIETTAGKIKCKGKAYQIQHTIDVGDKFAETQIQIALSRAEGEAVDNLPDVQFGDVIDAPAPVNTIVLRNYIGGRAPRSTLGWPDLGEVDFSNVTIRPGTPSGLPTDAQGFVTNYKTNRTRPLFTEAFIVDTPAIEDVSRDKREVEFDQSAEISIRNDLLEVVFNE